jgi:tRNA pseudouridine38-40 synthase
MEKASNVLEGTHDFTQFANTTTEKNRPPSNSRTLYNVSFEMEKEFLIFSFTGNGFLYNMVRNLVGALVEVGQKKLPFEDFKVLLSPEIRPRCYTTMPPQALCLKEIVY